jgi:hypothetical protein
MPPIPASVRSHSGQYRYLSFFQGLAVLLILLQSWPAAGLQTETHRYLQQSDDQREYFNWILEQSDGYLLQAVSAAEEHRAIMDEFMATRLWTLTNPTEDTEVEARRVENRIVLRGRFHGYPIDRRLIIDDSPWYQSLSASLRHFLAASQASTEFWTLRPDKLTVHKVRAKKMGSETLQLMGRQVETKKVEVCLTGLAALFGRARYWFRASDHLLLRYQGPKGLPGVPATTITIEPPF